MPGFKALDSLATCDRSHGGVICQGPDLAGMIQNVVGAVGRDGSVGLHCTFGLVLKPPNASLESLRPEF